MSYFEETLSEESIFEGRIVHLKKLSVRLPNGKASTREVIDHPGAVAVLVEPKAGSVVLVKQYRKACERELWEIPAGKLEPNEIPERAAIRELAEETGYRTEKLVPVYQFFTSPGFANEKLYVYYATDLSEGNMQLDEDEFLDVHLVTKSDVLNMMASNQIEDAKTLVALLWWCQQTS